MYHQESSKLLDQNQHGFRSRRSCLTQLLEYFSDVHNSLESEGPVDAIYLDFRKAFDTVPHKRLISKVKSLGITGKILKWIESFLTGRTQRVIVKGVLSDSLSVWSGVPQGSVLGPILFLIFINDLLEKIKSKGKLFADDTKLYRSVKTQADRELLQEDLLKLQDWCQKWLLQFNEKKCKVMHIGRFNPKYNYHLNNQTLEETNVEKDLGVYVTPDWKSYTHVSKVAAKANAMVGWIKKTFTYMDDNMFKALYPALVRSQMEYAVQAWSPQLRKDINQLEKVQQRATKLVHRLRNETYETRRKELNLMTLEERRMRGDLIEVFKIMHGIENVDREKFFKLTTNRTNRDTRGHDWRIFPQHVGSTRRKNFFDTRVIKNWNSLPKDIVRRQPIATFKKKLDEYFHERWLPTRA